MQKLATDVLHDIKKRATYWKVATIVTFVIAVIEFIFIKF